ncbi:MAG: hypothetical protein WDW38_005574 [Sanguina aurantia]
MELPQPLGLHLSLAGACDIPGRCNGTARPLTPADTALLRRCALLDESNLRILSPTTAAPSRQLWDILLSDVQMSVAFISSESGVSHFCLDGSATSNSGNTHIQALFKYVLVDGDPPEFLQRFVTEIEAVSGFKGSVSNVSVDTSITFYRGRKGLADILLTMPVVVGHHFVSRATVAKNNGLLKFRTQTAVSTGAGFVPVITLLPTNDSASGSGTILVFTFHVEQTGPLPAIQHPSRVMACTQWLRYMLHGQSTTGEACRLLNPRRIMAATGKHKQQLGIKELPDGAMTMEVDDVGSFEAMTAAGRIRMIKTDPATNHSVTATLTVVNSSGSLAVDGTSLLGNSLLITGTGPHGLGSEDVLGVFQAIAGLAGRGCRQLTGNPAAMVDMASRQVPPILPGTPEYLILVQQALGFSAAAVNSRGFRGYVSDMTPHSSADYTYNSKHGRASGGVVGSNSSFIVGLDMTTAYFALSQGGREAKTPSGKSFSFAPSCKSDVGEYKGNGPAPGVRVPKAAKEGQKVLSTRMSIGLALKLKLSSVPNLPTEPDHDGTTAGIAAMPGKLLTYYDNLRSSVADLTGFVSKANGAAGLQQPIPAQQIANVADNHAEQRSAAIAAGDPHGLYNAIFGSDSENEGESDDMDVDPAAGARAPAGVVGAPAAVVGAGAGAPAAGAGALALVADVGAGDQAGAVGAPALVVGAGVGAPAAGAGALAPAAGAAAGAPASMAGARASAAAEAPPGVVGAIGAGGFGDRGALAGANNGHVGGAHANAIGPGAAGFGAERSVPLGVGEEPALASRAGRGKNASATAAPVLVAGLAPLEDEDVPLLEGGDTNMGRQRMSLGQETPLG